VGVDESGDQRLSRESRVSRASSGAMDNSGDGILDTYSQINKMNGGMIKMCILYSYE
jgi:hypothetical protein